MYDMVAGRSQWRPVDWKWICQVNGVKRLSEVSGGKGSEAGQRWNVLDNTSPGINGLMTMDQELGMVDDFEV